MVCDYADPTTPRFTVLLDTRAEALDPDGFEAAVELAASLAHAAALAACHTRLCSTTGLDVPTLGGLAASRHLLDRLCEVAQQPGPPVRPRALFGRTPPGGDLVHVGGAAEPALLSALRRRFRQVVVCDLRADPAPAVLPGVTRLAVRDPAGAAAAWNALVAG
jgi:hypothetical protein